MSSLLYHVSSSPHPPLSSYTPPPPPPGSPLLYFGDGSCATNAICEIDLADYLVDCALDPEGADMMNQTRDIGVWVRVV